MRACKRNPDHFGFYTDIVRRPAGTFPTITQKFISPILHAPQLVLPCKYSLPSIRYGSWTNPCLVAQMPYHSRISGRDEVRPIASTLIGAKGKGIVQKTSWNCN